MAICLKRAYDPPAKSDGYRVLVDRIWPRGVARDDLQIDAWLKDVAPSSELRKWFGHDPARWDEFRKRYARELEQRSEAIGELCEKARAGQVTLVFGARDTEHNHASRSRSISSTASNRELRRHPPHLGEDPPLANGAAAEPDRAPVPLSP